jgi:hypothetical protein
MVKHVKVTGQEQNNENNHSGGGHKNPSVFIGHDLGLARIWFVSTGQHGIPTLE